MYINYDFGDLEAFLAIAEAGTFQAAAHNLNISQPALSRRIQKLEAALEVKLLERTTRAVKLTLAGKTLRARAQSMVEDAAETILTLRDESARFEHQRNAIISVAAIASVLQKLLPGSINQLRTQGYNARIRILDRLANDVAEAVAAGDADFGLGTIPAFDPGLQFHALADDPFMVVFPASHALATKREVNWLELEDHDLILPMKGSGNRMAIDEALAKARLQLGWMYEVRRSTTALQLVEACLGIAVLPHSALANTREDVLAARPLCAPAMSRTTGVITRSGHTLTRPAQALYNIICQQV